jgi:hypothetical protein
VQRNLFKLIDVKESFLYRARRMRDEATVPLPQLLFPFIVLRKKKVTSLHFDRQQLEAWGRGGILTLLGAKTENFQLLKLPKPCCSRLSAR